MKPTQLEQLINLVTQKKNYYTLEQANAELEGRGNLYSLYCEGKTSAFLEMMLLLDEIRIKDNFRQANEAIKLMRQPEQATQAEKPKLSKKGTLSGMIAPPEVVAAKVAAMNAARLKKREQAQAEDKTPVAKMGATGRKGVTYQRTGKYAKKKEPAPPIIQTHVLPDNKSNYSNPQFLK